LKGNWGELGMVSGITQQLTSKMADTRVEDRSLSGLRSLAETLDYTEKSWIETKETLDKLKTWALVQENRYFYLSDFTKLFRHFSLSHMDKYYFKQTGSSVEVFELLCHNFDRGNMVCGNSFISYPPSHQLPTSNSQFSALPSHPPHPGGGGYGVTCRKF